jgi:hypothetical protein
MIPGVVRGAEVARQTAVANQSDDWVAIGQPAPGVWQVQRPYVFAGHAQGRQGVEHCLHVHHVAWFQSWPPGKSFPAAYR